MKYEEYAKMSADKIHGIITKEQKEVSVKWPKLKLGDIVAFELEDHCTDAKSWVKVKDGFHSICFVKVVGQVLKDDANYLTIAMLLQRDNSTFAASFTVVKACVTKIRKLK